MLHLLQKKQLEGMDKNKCFNFDSRDALADVINDYLGGRSCALKASKL